MLKPVLSHAADDAREATYTEGLDQSLIREGELFPLSELGTAYEDVEGINSKLLIKRDGSTTGILLEDIGVEFVQGSLDVGNPTTLDSHSAGLVLTLSDADSVRTVNFSGRLLANSKGQTRYLAMMVGDEVLCVSEIKHRVSGRIVVRCKSLEDAKRLHIDLTAPPSSQ